MDLIEEALEGWRRSAQAWIDAVDRGDVNRSLLLDSVMLGHCGNVDGLDVLDVGCGEGRFCRMLSERGARIVGLEPTATLRDAASSRDPSGRYMDGCGAELPFQDESFDIVVFYLVLIDIGDYRQAIREAARVLRWGGKVVVANVNPFASCGRWRRDEQKVPLYRYMDNYFGERAETLAWGDIEIVNWHRPLEDYMRAFLGANLRLTEYREPSPSNEAVAVNPDMATECRVPIFHTMVWTKE